MPPVQETTYKKPYSYPPFSYGPQNDPAKNVFNMVPENAAPALVVWLTLVTSVDFLNALDNAEGTNLELVDAEDFAKATNLSNATVEQIFDKYRNASDERKNAFHAVVDTFNEYSQDAGYDGLHCPNGGSGSTQGKDVLTNLALRGAAVNPVPPEAGMQPKSGDTA